MKKLYTLFCLIFLLQTAIGQDTFSICAVDTLTGEVGSAGASCIDENAIPGGCIILSDVHPGVGVIHTQAYWNPANQNYAKQLMNMGLPPQQIIDSLVANDIQNNPTIRQYGIVDLHEDTARCAAYTAVNCDDYKNHIIGPNYTIQGNILLGQEILDSMEARFLAAEGELACKLMAALQGAKVIGADTRCMDDGVSSLSAFLRVAQPDDPPEELYLDLNVPSTPEGTDPIDSLQVMVDDWGGCLNTGLGSAARNRIITLFPNPSNGNITIGIHTKNNDQLELEVFDNFGCLKFEQNLGCERQQRITTELPPGIYFYRVSTDSWIYGSGKLLII